MHEKDQDCTVDPETMACVECGVDHGGAPCPECGGVAFHEPGCSGAGGGPVLGIGPDQSKSRPKEMREPFE